MTIRNPQFTIRNWLLLFALIHQLSTLNSFSQLPTNNLTPATLAVMTDTNGALKAPTNFFTANSNRLNAVVAASTNLATTTNNGLMSSNQVIKLNAAQTGATTLTNLANGNGGALTNLNLASPNLVPTGATYDNGTSAFDSDNSEASSYGPITVTPGVEYYIYFPGSTNDVFAYQDANEDVAIVGNNGFANMVGKKFTPATSTVYLAGAVTNAPVGVQLYKVATNFVGDGIWDGALGFDATIPEIVLNTSGAVVKDQPMAVINTSGTHTITANVAGNADNQHDDVLCIQQKNDNRWSSIKFWDKNGVQLGALGVGLPYSGLGSVLGHPTNTYYVNIGYTEIPLKGWYFVASAKIGWGAESPSDDLVAYYHTNGMGPDYTSDDINTISTNVSFRVSLANGRTFINTNNIPGGGLTVIGVNSLGTNTYSMTATGYTNSASRMVRVFGFAGTTPYFSNRTSHVAFNLPGTMPFLVLQTNECVVGTSCVASNIVDF